MFFDENRHNINGNAVHLEHIYTFRYDDVRLFVPTVAGEMFFNLSKLNLKKLFPRKFRNMIQCWGETINEDEWIRRKTEWFICAMLTVSCPCDLQVGESAVFVLGGEKVHR